MSESDKRKGGRPPRWQGPKLPHDELDKLLVEGEFAVDGYGFKTRVWPTQRQLARRFGVAPSLINAFAKEHRCAERKRVYLEQAAPSSDKPERPIERAEQAAPPEPARGPGRPRKADAPMIPYEELDRLLVFGEVQVLNDGRTLTVYPTYRELAERYGVASSVIASYSKSRNCMRRREQNARRIASRVEDKLVNLRAEVISVGEDRLVQMIDKFLLSFEKALEEGRVRADNPADVNTLARLKSFILGGADSRHEVRTILSLESLQERYARVMRNQHEATPEMSGIIETRGVLVEEPEPPKLSVQLKTERSDSCSFSGPSSVEHSSNESAVPYSLVANLAALARELALVSDPDPDDDGLLENQVLSAVEQVEAHLRDSHVDQEET